MSKNFIKLAVFVFTLLISHSAQSSHLMGGEITWKCFANGQFRFYLKVYRDCNGVPFGPPVSLDVHNCPGVTSIPMNVVSQTDISSQGFNNSSIHPCPTCANPGTVGGAVEEWYFESNLITLNGVPPANGWVFSYSNCCRNAAIDNLTNPGSQGFTLRAIMYPYNGQNTNPCYDSSPEFAEIPNTIICNGYPFSYNHNAIDDELDSLVYSFGVPLDSWGSGAWTSTNPPALGYSPNYSSSSPLPGTAQNPNNIPASIDSSLGIISFLSYTPGNFVTVTKCSAYKCGILVAEIYREIQIALLGCQPILGTGIPNNPPDVTKPFINPNTGLYTETRDTMYAGEIVDFFLSATDFDFVPNLPGGLQTLTLEASGNEFGTGFTNSMAGCIIPPCATLNPPPPAQAVAGTGTQFHWETNCDHLGFTNGCVNLSNTYNFVIKVRDNFCPANGITFTTIAITILAPPVMKAPQIHCVNVQPNGDVQLTWPTPTDTYNVFSAYMIYHANNIAGPYTLIDSVKTLAQGNYTHVGANGQNASNFYYLQSRIDCNGLKFSQPGDTVAAIKLNAVNGGGGLANLSWNAIRNPLLSSSSPFYHIWMEYPLGTWNMIDSTTALTYTDTVNITICEDSVNYRIEILDSIGCASVSNIDGATFQNFSQPQAPSLRCLVADNSGSVTLSWVAPADTSFSFDGYFISSAPALAGPYTIIDSVKNYATTSYTDINANIMSGPVYYFVQSLTNCGPSFSLGSDTLQAMRLNVANIGNNANLTWNALHTPKLTSSNAYYHVYKEYPLGTWSLIDSTQTTTYIDPLNLCNDTLNYRIELTDLSGCISKSTVDGERFVDNTVPDPPGLRCINVNANGSITLNWVTDPDTGLDFNSYHLYKSNTLAGPYAIVDSIFNFNSLSYTDNLANAYNNDFFYFIKSRTGCGVQYSPGCDTLQAIRLNVTNPLGQVANLAWNAIHTPNLVTSTGIYDIYKEYPLGTWNLLKSTPNLNEIDSNIICNDTINYRIEIGDASGCISSSTIDGDRFIDNTIPDAPELRCANVNANGSVSLTWVADPDTGLDFNSFHIYRSNNIAGPYIVIDSIFNFNTVTYTDNGANAYSGDLFYYLKSRTGCGVKYSYEGDTLQAIRLNLVNNGGQYAQLTWNAIRTPLLSTSTGAYDVYKEYPQGTWTKIATTPNLFYNDSNKICKDTVKYFVTIGDAIGCTSNSTVAGDLFIDNTVPLAPELKCVAVATNGDVTITWVPPVDTGMMYNSYHVFHSNNAAGPFTQLDSIFNYAQTSFAHAGVNANINTPYYYVQTRTGCGVQYSDPSDTLRSIKLNVNNTGTGVAYLQWNAVHTPLLSTSSSYYRIYREYPVNSWTIIDSTTALDYLDTINLCNAFINYRIEIEDFSGCISVSNVDGDLFQDVTPPSLTVLDTISVDPATGQVHVSWQQNTSDDTQGYIIYLYNGASWDSIGAVSGIGTLTWIHGASNANSESQTYSIAAYDSCGNLSPIGVEHNTIYVTDTLNKCEGTITLNWNQYINMPNGVAAYNVYYNVNNGPYTLLGSVSGTTYNYVHTPIKKDTTYCYIIRAIGNDIWRTSTSNRTCQLADALVFPKYTYLKTASVTAANEISISAFVDPTNDVNKYKLMRSLNPNSDYTPIQYLPNTGATTIDFIDEDVETNAYSYYYRVIPVSTCETDMDTNNFGRTILLRVKANENLTNTLSWTPYEDWSGKVQQYKIYRQMDGVWSTTPIAIVPDDIQTYLDDIANYYRGTGEFCYYIEANEGIGNLYGFIETSLSNEACDAQIPHLYIPNAFTPGGNNPVFKPEGAFIDSANYYFAVFNRWGQPIYETTNFTEGWDGTYENAEAPQGVYAYVAKMIGTNGTALVRRGNVSLLR